MFHIKYVFYFIFFPIIIGIPQINLHKTGWVSENEFNNVFEQICLRVDTLNEEGNLSREIISYCSNELPLRFDIPTNDFFPKFTFNQLSKENITSEQLYHWSTPIDIIEDYQFYLNELLTLNKSSLSDNLFYNCTLPRFGSICQYEMNYYHENYSSLSDLINGFYRNYTYKPTEMTCYKHLKCNRGHSTICLDWTEICNGRIDCLNDGLDEEYCWQLEINECNSNEYRCQNGQCIPKEFFQDHTSFSDCLDGSDEIDLSFVRKSSICAKEKPSFICEDVTCKHTPFTSSCLSQREKLIIENMYSIRNNSVSNQCWSAFVCIVIQLEDRYLSNCTASCEGDTCLEDIEYHCPDMFMIPTIPVIYSDIYFAYEKYKSTMTDYKIFQYPYVCYNNFRYDAYFKNDSNKSYNYSVVLFNNFTCYRLIDPFYLSQIEVMPLRLVYIPNLYEQLWQYQQIYNYNSTICDRSNMYQCNNSLKCISKHRLMNGRNDCPHGDDENRISADSNVTTEEILDINEIDDGNLVMKLRYAEKHISFQTICDGYTELLPKNIDGQNETDETDCEQWPCNNIYTHCNHIWNCFDGADEINCGLSSSSYCPSDQHQCVSPHTNQFICLPITKANDGHIDCLGAVDEPKLCRTDYEPVHYDNFYCKNQGMKPCLTLNELCNKINECDDGDDEQFCIQNRTSLPYFSICWSVNFTLGSNVENFLCKQMNHYTKTRIVYFTLNEMKYLTENLTDQLIDTKSSLLNISDEYQHNCHRGIDLNIWLNNHTKQNICFCPPSYYGDRCQYQNQRISLSMKFQTLSDSWQIPFAIIILLIDNQQRIHSYEQFTYLSSRDCKIKHQIYLIYSNRPKISSQNYRIHIDIYEKLSFKYRGSYFYPLKFTFLPVHRLSLMIQIPSDENKIENCLNNPCIHGKCIKYLNNNQSNDIFCQCYRGWSGRYCTIEHSSMCTYDSLSIGVSSDNRSICLCPLNRFGRRCLINRTICQNLTCQNGGQCIPMDEYQISTKNFVCICSNGFIGERCEINENEIILSFDKHIILSQSIFIHFIEVRKDRLPRRSTTLQTMPIQQDFIRIFWSRPFHIVFIEFFEKQYYLAVVQSLSNLSKTIDLSDRCLHINEIFNETILKLHLIRRIKYYHLPCQLTRLNLSCFYDDIHLCLCYYFQNQRLTNCFEFNHSMTFDCSGQSVCLHNGTCFQDTFDCPTKSICKCSSCFYGTRCQFSTNGFGLSLDAILGYQILPKVSLTHQLPIIKLSLTLTIIWIIAGLIDSILCMIIFKSKVVREVGCGLYLLCSSIISLFTVIIFGLKFVILVLTQMIIISNRTFLQVQCYSIDFLLQICLYMNQWLNACVAVERAMTVIKGTSFVKSKSKQAAKYVIIILLIVTIATGIHDPINRRLTDEDIDDNENTKRIWCIVSYSLSLEVYNYIIHIVHFFGPFIINFISAIIVIIKKSRQQSFIQKQKTYKELLRKQFHQHKNLLTAPIILVILALPRLTIAFVSKCMKTANDSWIFLIGYFISFIPPMLTFLIFILPSKFYKKEFRKTIDQYQSIVKRRLNYKT